MSNAASSSPGRALLVGGKESGAGEEGIGLSRRRSPSGAEPAAPQAVAVLRRRWVAAVVVLVAGGAVGLLAAAAVPTRWSTTAEVALSPSGSGYAEVSAQMATEAQRVRSTDLLSTVGRRLGLEPAEVDRSLTVDVVADSTVLRIGFRAANAATAARGANEVATAFLEESREADRRAIEARRTSLRATTASVRRLLRRSSDPDLRGGYAQRLVDLDRQLGELDQPVGGPSLVREASLPTAPAGPPWMAYLAGGVVLAAAPAFVAAHWRDRGARAIQDERWLADLLGVPVAPVERGLAGEDIARLVTLGLRARRPLRLVAIADPVGTDLGDDLAALLGTAENPYRRVVRSETEAASADPEWPCAGDEALMIDLPEDFDAPGAVLTASRCDAVIAVAVRGEGVDRLERFVDQLRWGGREPTLVVLLDPNHELSRKPEGAV
ncbi:MAG TPA: hypothetical protein VM575_09275 [Nocardioides sp.]|nr:hypothetical protein [Nocardioides sp.]